MPEMLRLLALLTLPWLAACTKHEPLDLADADQDGAPEDMDCDDADPAVFPGNAELCNGVDDDCDGFADERLEVAWYLDGDADGHGDLATVMWDCAEIAGAVTLGDDCDDLDGDVFPGAAETCDGVDEDCDGLVDDGVSGTTWYADYDGDGFGDGPAVDACEAPADHASASGDCDETDATVFPGAAETCDAVDEDCDGDVDEEALGAPAWYADADGDGFGDASTATIACDAPTDAIADGTDCDDTDGAVFPAATEGVADGTDQDCDGGELCWTDADGDGQGTSATVTSPDADCAAAGESTVSSDCDDGDGTVFVGAVEVAGDEIDQDCDGAESCFTDADSDGWGTDVELASADADCDDAGEATATGDCDDAAAAVNPDGVETVANGVDDDCDGNERCWTDNDGDDYGTTTSVGSADLDCADGGEATISTDCDDTLSSRYPGATEITGDGVDQDCSSGEICYADTDGDGFGASATVASADADCAEAGESSVSTDCDDASASDYPGAVETVANADDEDCNGGEICRQDNDADGYGSTSTSSSLDADCADAGESYVSTDCDDTTSARSPVAPEVVADGVDQDCVSGDACYADSDGDGYGSAVKVVSADLDCADAGEDNASTDCDDGDNYVNPGVADTTCDGVDDNCDGTVDYTITGLYFDGSSGDYVNIPVSSSSTLALGTPFVIEAWVRWESGTGLIFNKWVSGAEDKYLGVTTTTGVVTGYAYAGSSGYIFGTTVTTGLTANDWTHVAFAWNTGGIVRLFVNGVEVYEYDDPASKNPSDSNGTIRIGGHYRDSAYVPSMKGFISQVRVSQYDEYTTTFTPSSVLPVTSGRTVALWQLDEGSGTTAYDSGPSGLTGTITGAAWTTVECIPD